MRRVLSVVNRFPSPSETFITAKALGLRRRGWDVHIATAAHDRAAWEAMGDRDRGLLEGRVHVLGADRRDAVRALPGSLAGLLARGPLGRLAGVAGEHGPRAAFDHLRPLDLLVLRLRPDVVHFEFGGVVARPARLRRIATGAVLTSFRGWDLNFQGLDDPGMFAEVWQASDAVHVLGRDLAARLAGRGCPPDLPRIVIPPGVDVDAFRRRRPPVHRDGPLRVATVARLHWKKGLEHGVAAVALATRRGVEVRYRIAGAGPHEPAVRAAIEHHGLGGRVELLGHLAPRQVRDLLEDTDVLLHPAVSEGFGNAVLEAQAMEVPVVCSDADGLAENVEAGVTGFVTARRDPAAAADALARLAADPALRSAMGAAGRQRVVERYSLGSHLDAFEEAYTALAAGRPLPQR